MAVSSPRRPSPPPAAPPVQALAVRRFNRFYTRQIGLLEEHLVRSPFSLAEARVLYELAQRERTSARALSAELGLDPGYLSRILRGLRRRGLLRAQTSPEDGRQVDLSLTDRGRRTFAELDGRSTAQVEALLGGLPEGGRRRLVHAMRAIEDLLSTGPESAGPLVLRAPLPGDLGYVIHRHGVLYAREHGYDATFEGLVARIVADFAEKQDPARDRCILAERAGEILGAVFLMKESATVGRLRLFYVEPEARGQGIGARLVEECLRFARQSGYRKVVLWTQGDLHAARHLYEKAGFRRVSAKPHRSFGRKLVGENWELVL